VATVAPALPALEETINTLDYAMRARNVKNRPELNTKVSQKAMIRDLTRENDRLKAMLEACRSRMGIYLTQEEYNELQAQQVHATSLIAAVSEFCARWLHVNRFSQVA
jgi:kinesin family member 11